MSEENVGGIYYTAEESTAALLTSGREADTTTFIDGGANLGAVKSLLMSFSVFSQFRVNA